MATKKKAVKKTAQVEPKIEARALPVLAAAFARSNMGQGKPSVLDVVRQLEPHVRWGVYDWSVPDLEDCVHAFCGSFVETDEQMGWFMDEAKGWVKELKNMPVSHVAKTWPDMAALIDEAQAWVAIGAAPAHQRQRDSLYD